MSNNADGKLSIGQAIAVGVNTTSPAYSLAAVLGAITAYVHFAAPAVILISFIPMFLTSLSFMYLNRRDPDCGTTFSWVTRAIGARSGFIAGWVIAACGVLLIGSLAETAVTYSLSLFGMDTAAENRVLVVSLSAIIVSVMVGLAIAGSDSSIKLQVCISVAQVAILLIFGGAALWAAISGGVSWGAASDWINITGQGTDNLVAAILLAVFLFWGIESATNLSEECRRSSDAGKASVLSISLLVVTYVTVAIGVVLYMAARNFAEDESGTGILEVMSSYALGGFGFLIVLAVAISALASTQSTLIPGSRAVLSMARRGALPSQLGLMHPRWKTPFVSYSVLAVLALGFYVPLALLSPDTLGDVLASLGMLVAFYYAITAISCTVFYRNHIKSSRKGLLMLGVLPLIGASGLLAVLVLSVQSLLADPENTASGIVVMGLPLPLAVAGGVVIGGVIAMAVRVAVAPRFFRRRGAVAANKYQSPLVVDPSTLPKGGVVLDCNTDSASIARLCVEVVDLAEVPALPVYLVFGTEPPEYAGEEYEDTVRALEDQGRMLFAYARSILASAGITLIHDVLVRSSAAESIESVSSETEAQFTVGAGFSFA